jgi:hypothetical protein
MPSQAQSDKGQDRRKRHKSTGSTDVFADPGEAAAAIKNNPRMSRLGRDPC